MLYKNIRRHTCHHISQKTASHSCDRSEKHKQKCIIHMSLTDSRIYSYYCKNPQSHRVQHQHKFVICFSSVSLQKLSFEIKNKEHNTSAYTGFLNTAGGITPRTISLIIPPPTAVATPRTLTPKISILRSTPTIAPEAANATVPAISIINVAID